MKNTEIMLCRYCKKFCLHRDGVCLFCEEGEDDKRED